MSEMDLERVRQKAIQIAELAKGIPPREFAAAISIALGAMLPVAFPRDAWAAVIQGVIDGAFKVVQEGEEKRGLTS